VSGGGSTCWSGGQGCGGDASAGVGSLSHHHEAGQAAGEGCAFWLRGAREESRTAVWAEVSLIVCAGGSDVGAPLCPCPHTRLNCCSQPRGCAIVGCGEGQHSTNFWAGVCVPSCPHPRPHSTQLTSPTACAAASPPVLPIHHLVQCRALTQAAHHLCKQQESSPSQSAHTTNT
jgi:hypothetical protein